MRKQTPIKVIDEESKARVNRRSKGKSACEKAITMKSKAKQFDFLFYRTLGEQSGEKKPPTRQDDSALTQSTAASSGMALHYKALRLSLGSSDNLRALTMSSCNVN